MHNPPIRIALAGLGTVGGGALTILRRQSALIAERCGRPIEVVAISARNQIKAQTLPLENARWFDDPLQLATLDIDVIVEAIGGSEGPARLLVEAALAQGKSVVTANKALIAHHGIHLANLAEQSGAILAFEAAVAGGIPIIKGLRDGLAANHFRRVAGILNGTCNYILSTMQATGKPFVEVLSEAQALGYAEADPSFDIDGIDTAHKTAILASLAFGVAPSLENMHIEGIRHIQTRDMQFARELGYGIKLLGLAEQTTDGIAQRVHPCLVPLTSPLANVHDAYNAIVVEGDAVGKVFFEGRGAGAGPTGSSVVADIMDIARGTTYKPFTLPVNALKPHSPISMEALAYAYYLRLAVQDKPGVLADITGTFRDHGISVHSLLQPSHAENEAAQIVLTTHATTEKAVSVALKTLSTQGFMVEAPQLIRIEA